MAAYQFFHKQHAKKYTKVSGGAQSLKSGAPPVLTNSTTVNHGPTLLKKKPGRGIPLPTPQPPAPPQPSVFQASLKGAHWVHGPRPGQKSDVESGAQTPITRLSKGANVGGKQPVKEGGIKNKGKGGVSATGSNASQVKKAEDMKPQGPPLSHSIKMKPNIPSASQAGSNASSGRPSNPDIEKPVKKPRKIHGNTEPGGEKEAFSVSSQQPSQNSSPVTKNSVFSSAATSPETGKPTPKARTGTASKPIGWDKNAEPQSRPMSPMNQTTSTNTSTENVVFVYDNNKLAAHQSANQTANPAQLFQRLSFLKDHEQSQKLGTSTTGSATAQSSTPMTAPSSNMSPDKSRPGVPKQNSFPLNRTTREPQSKPAPSGRRIPAAKTNKTKGPSHTPLSCEPGTSCGICSAFPTHEPPNPPHYIVTKDDTKAGREVGKLAQSRTASDISAGDETTTTSTPQTGKPTLFPLNRLNKEMGKAVGEQLGGSAFPPYTGLQMRVAKKQAAQRSTRPKKKIPRQRRVAKRPAMDRPSVAASQESDLPPIQSAASTIGDFIARTPGILGRFVNWLFGLDDFDTMVLLVGRLMLRLLWLWFVSTFVTCLKQQMYLLYLTKYSA